MPVKSDSFLSKLEWKDPWVRFGIILIVLGIVCYLWVAIDLIVGKIFFWGGKTDWELTSQVGGFIGGIATPIWTLVGALFIYRTLKLQFDALESQKQQSSTQQFESILFNMMQMQFHVKTEIEFSSKFIFVWLSSDEQPPSPSTKYKGEAFFRFTKENYNLWFNEFKGNYDDHDDFMINSLSHLTVEHEKNSTPSSTKLEDRLIYKSQLFYEYYGEYFEHYLYHLETLLILIEKEEQRKKGNDETFEADFYVQMFKAQLTVPELFHIFYASFTMLNLKRLIHKYKILEKINARDLATSEHYSLINSK